MIMGIAGSSGAGATIVSDNARLDESDFLMLLITQLANQDPLDPLDDREFIQQMATLSTLSETMDMNENIQMQNMIQAASLVGYEVEAIGPNGEHVEGIVTEVWFIDNEPWLTIDEDAVVSLEYVIRIA